MKRIFLGLILVFFDFKIHMTVATGLIPDCVGYLLILSGLRRFAAHSEWFTHGRLPAVLLAVWTAGQYAAVAAGIPQAGGMAWDAANVLFLLLELFLLYAVTYGMADLEMETGGGEMRTSRLAFLWKLMAALFLLALLSGRLAVVFRVCAFAACICYLAFFYTAWKVYENRAA